jgi:hypothetical protein
VSAAGSSADRLAGRATAAQVAARQADSSTQAGHRSAADGPEVESSVHNALGIATPGFSPTSQKIWLGNDSLDASVMTGCGNDMPMMANDKLMIGEHATDPSCTHMYVFKIL